MAPTRFLKPELIRMPDPTQTDQNLGDAAGASRRGADTKEQKHSRRTQGTNRDFDDTGEADNQAHGHPREEREKQGSSS
jgi:hypothetical protein